MKRILLIAAAFLVVSGLVVFVVRGTRSRDTGGGGPGTWTCSPEGWVRNGSPEGEEPDFPCGGESTTWHEQTFDHDGIVVTFSIPEGAVYREEIAEDNGKTRVASFYIEIGSGENIVYQLYAVYQPEERATEESFPNIKSAMDPDSVQEIMVGEYPAIQGLIDADSPKGRLATVIKKDDHILFISTSPPTEENGVMTDNILKTFTFN